MANSWFIESLIEATIAAIVILLRIFARTRVVGIKGWQGDDYLIILGLVWYVVSLFCLAGTNKNNFNTAFTDDQTASMTVEQIATIAKGSKQNFTLWISYTSFLWSLKGCMLFFYWRLTMGLNQRRLVKITSWLAGATYIASLLTILCHCRPIQRNWQVRPRPTDCVPQFVNFYVVGITNFITDGILLCIPAPLLFRSKMSWQRKLLFTFLLCSGVFIMIATALRTTLSLITLYREGGKNMGSIMVWAVRELTMAIFVVNAPCIKPLFSSGICCGSRGGSRSSLKKSSKRRTPHDIELGQCSQCNCKKADCRKPQSSQGSKNGASANVPHKYGSSSHSKQSGLRNFVPAGPSRSKARNKSVLEKARLAAIGFTDSLFSTGPWPQPFGKGSAGSSGLYSNFTIKSKTDEDDFIQLGENDNDRSTGTQNSNGSGDHVIPEDIEVGGGASAPAANSVTTEEQTIAKPIMSKGRMSMLFGNG